MNRSVVPFDDEVVSSELFEVFRYVNVARRFKLISGAVEPLTHLKDEENDHGPWARSEEMVPHYVPPAAGVHYSIHASIHIKHFIMSKSTNVGKFEDRTRDTKAKTPDSRPECPCKSFSSSAQVISALSSNDQAQKLIQWIKGDSIQTDGDKIEKLALSEHQICTNNVGYNQIEGKCAHRVGAAYCILNEIRDGCRVFLEKESPPPDLVMMKPKLVVPYDAPKYEEAFPSLSASASSQAPNILKPKKKVKKKIKPVQLSATNQSPGITDITSQSTVQPLDANTIKVKRRIRPAPAQSPSPWGNLAPMQTDLPSSTPWPGIQTITQKSTGLEMERDPMIRAMSPISTPKTETQPRSSEGWPGNEIVSQNMAKHLIFQDPMERMMSLSTSPNKDVQASNTAPAPIPEDIKTLLNYTVEAYCVIIKSQLAPSIALELQLMLRLVTLSDNDGFVKHNNKNKMQSLRRLFKTPGICRHFASQVLEKLKNLLVNLDHGMLRSLLGLSAFVEQLPHIAKEIQRTLESRRNALLSEGKYDHDGESTGLVVSGRSTILTMPFQEKRDSRHNYRSQDLSSIYNNREQSRGETTLLISYQLPMSNTY